LGAAQVRADRTAGAMPSAYLLGRNWVYPPECLAEYRAWREQQGRTQKAAAPDPAPEPEAEPLAQYLATLEALAAREVAAKAELAEVERETKALQWPDVTRWR